MDSGFRQYIIDNLDRAIQEGWIRAFFQPVIRSANGRVCEEESLARWDDPVYGMLLPDSFIPILNEADLTYKLDLFITETVIEKMKDQVAEGLFLVPGSVNISGADFYSCDMVEEIRRRVDESGLGRDRLIIEISETYLCQDYERIKKEIVRFRSLGFKVWLDDFGKGFSSPMSLQDISFDALKLDQVFMQLFSKGDRKRIILTELIKIAMVLGIDTVAVGVENEEQAEFLKEVGCSKLQGLYFCRAIDFGTIKERYRTGAQIGFENPAETDYYATLGKVNLYDLSATANDDIGDTGNYFDTMPMAILESDGRKAKLIRCNRSYRAFLINIIESEWPAAGAPFRDYIAGPGSLFMKAVKTCADDGNQVVVDDMTQDGEILHILIRRVAVNPLTQVASIAVVVLGVVDRESQGTQVTYTYLARALAADYIYLYLVDLDTEKYMEFSPEPDKGDLNVARRGQGFFEVRRREAKDEIYEPDREAFLDSFSRENITDTLKDHGTFSMTYRMCTGDEPVYVHLKAVKVRGRGNNIIIGVNNVDAQMKQRETMERVKEERLTYSRVMALSGDYLCIYTVDPETDHFERYSASEDFEKLGLDAEGVDFFSRMISESEGIVYKEDLKRFTSMATKEKLLARISSGNVFVMDYRLMLGGEPIYASFKAAMIEEKDGARIIIGITNIDAQRRRDQEFLKQLSAAKTMANIDELTGVKNKHAYVDEEIRMNGEIEDGIGQEFAIIVCDLNGLKEINDSKGHQAGDRFIKDGCSIICSIFQHSPVFRVGGDEFVVIAKGSDFENVDSLMQQLYESNIKNIAAGEVVIAGGMARFDFDRNVAAVFERADKKMYVNKTELKRGCM